MDIGEESRYFYVSKVHSNERNMGCDMFHDKIEGSMFANTEVMRIGGASMKGEPKQKRPDKNNHPTVKPLELMRYLIKMVSREGQVVLDPFAGSGSTLIACKQLGRDYIGFEKEKEYVDIAKARLKSVVTLRDWF